MSKRTLLIVVALIASVAMAATGTLAYLSDSDADVNVMTLGNVDILQNEQQWNDDQSALEPFENNKPLYPYVPEEGKEGVSWDEESKEEPAYRRFGMDNVVDKYVTVTNTGKSDAYVRTIIAAEMGEYMEIAEFRNKIIGFSRNVEVGDEFKFPDTWVWDDFYVAQIDGKNYMIMTATHQDPVAAGETTIPSLLQVYMNKDCGNEEVEKVDGNDNGTYDIIVLSQAIQTEGFDDAKTALDTGFGEATKENVEKWFSSWEDWSAESGEIGSPGDENDTNNPPEMKQPNGDDDSVTFEVPAGAVEVASADELADEIGKGKTVFLLKEGTYKIPEACKGKTLTLVGADLENTILEIVPAGQGEADGQLDYNFDGSTVTFQNLTIKSNNKTYAGYARLTGTYKNVNFDQQYCLQRNSSFEYCTFDVTGDQYNIWTWGAPTATFDHCTFNTDGKALLVYNQSCNLTVSNCLFNDSEALAPVKAAIETGADDINNGTVKHNIVVTNTTVNGFAINTTECDEVTTTLWANKNGLDHDHLNVVVDGVDVY